MIKEMSQQESFKFLLCFVNSGYLEEFQDPLHQLFIGDKITDNASLSSPIFLAPLTVRELFSSLSNTSQPDQRIDFYFKASYHGYSVMEGNFEKL